jgi:hypothetical protein
VRGFLWMPQMTYKDPLFGSAADYARRTTPFRFRDQLPSGGREPGRYLLQLAIEKAGSLDTDAVRRLSGPMKERLSGVPSSGTHRTEHRGPVLTFQIQKARSRPCIRRPPQPASGIPPSITGVFVSAGGPLPPCFFKEGR